MDVLLCPGKDEDLNIIEVPEGLPPAALKSARLTSRWSIGNLVGQCNLIQDIRCNPLEVLIWPLIRDAASLALAHSEKHRNPRVRASSTIPI